MFVLDAHPPTVLFLSGIRRREIRLWISYTQACG